jgi:hypothetical protein
MIIDCKIRNPLLFLAKKPKIAFFSLPSALCLVVRLSRGGHFDFILLN